MLCYTKCSVNETLLCCRRHRVGIDLAVGTSGQDALVVLALLGLGHVVGLFGDVGSADESLELLEEVGVVGLADVGDGVAPGGADRGLGPGEVGSADGALEVLEVGSLDALFKLLPLGRNRGRVRGHVQHVQCLRHLLVALARHHDADARHETLGVDTLADLAIARCVIDLLVKAGNIVAGRRSASLQLNVACNKMLEKKKKKKENSR